MRLALLQIFGDAAETLLAELADRGYVVEVINEMRGIDRSRETAALVPVLNEVVPEFLRIVARYGGSVVSLANTDLPPVFLPEYHMGSSAPSVEGGVNVFLFRVRRYERIH